MAGDPWAVGVRAWPLLQALLFLIARATVPAVRTGQVLAVDRAEAGPVLWWLRGYMWGHHLQTYLNVTFCVLFRPRPRIYTEPLPVGTAPLAKGGRRGAAPRDPRHQALSGRRVFCSRSNVISTTEEKWFLRQVESTPSLSRLHLRVLLSSWAACVAAHLPLV